MRILWVEGENDYSVDLAKALQEKGYIISHTTGHFTDKPEAHYKTCYNNAETIDAKILYRRDSIRERWGEVMLPLNKDIVSFFEKIERDCYTISDRCNYNPLTFRERKTYFRDMIRFWLGYLKTENIEGIYFPCTPHTVWELVLMHAGRYYEIPTFYLSHTAINNRSVHRSTYEDIEEVPQDYLEGKTADTILSTLDPELRHDFLEDSIVTNIIKAQNDSFNNLGNLNTSAVGDRRETPPRTTLKAKIRKNLSWLYSFIFRPNDNRFYLPMAMDVVRNKSSWNKALNEHKQAAKELKSFYDAKSQELDFTCPYVYFPLHLQPELTTQPEAMIFEDQLLALETISQSLPDGWKIYVKENPRQYDTSINSVSGKSFRTVQDLKDLLNVSEKIYFAQQSTPTQTIIRNAKAIVVLTGTAGWEAMLWDKPCITLAHPWYGGCRSCIKVKTVQEMKKAFESIESYSPIRVQTDVAKFVHYYSDKLFIGSLADPANIGYNTRSYSELISNHANAIDQFFTQHTPKGQNVLG